MNNRSNPNSALQRAVIRICELWGHAEEFRTDQVVRSLKPNHAAQNVRNAIQHLRKRGALYAVHVGKLTTYKWVNSQQLAETEQ